MNPYAPITPLPTPDVTNQVPAFPSLDLFSGDVPMQEAVAREGAGWASARLHALGTELGTPASFHLGHLANKHEPELHTFDRFGHRIDEVEFHPAYHQQGLI